MHQLYRTCSSPRLIPACSRISPSATSPSASFAWVSRQVRPSFSRSSHVCTGCSICPTTGAGWLFRSATPRTSSGCDLSRGSSRRLPATDSAGWPSWSPDGDTAGYKSFAEGKPYRILVSASIRIAPPVAIADSSPRLTPIRGAPTGGVSRSTSFRASYCRSHRSRRRHQSAPTAVHELPWSHSRHSADGQWLTYTDAASTFAVDGRRACSESLIRDRRPKWCRSATRSSIATATDGSCGGATGSVVRLESAADDPADPVQRRPGPHSVCLPTASGSSS